MISKNQMKRVKRLENKKYRSEAGLFVAEGPKVVGDLCEVMTPQTIISTPNFPPSRLPAAAGCEHIEVSAEELRQVSFLQHPQQVIGIFRQPHITDAEREAALSSARSRPVLALDGIQDPGNLGTIIRIADWFGIRTIVCSPDTTDVWNPKVVQATMGSIAHVSVLYEPLPSWLMTLRADTPVYGTLLDGDNIYATPLSDHGVIVMGNEGNGISEPVRRLVNGRLLIPCFSDETHHAESLNVAIATAIVCSEMRRSRGMKL